VAVGPAGRDGDRCSAGQHREGCLAADPPGVGPGQQDLGGAEHADAVLGRDQARGKFFDDGRDLGFDVCRGLIECDDPLAEPVHGLVEDAGLSAGAGRARQAGAYPRPALAGQMAQLLAQLVWSGDDDRGEHGPGGLARVNRVVPVNHQQPQRFPVPVAAHLAWLRAGQHFPGRADGIDRVALARPASAHMPRVVDLGHLLAFGGQVAGQAQPVMPGPLHRPCHLAAACRIAGPGQQVRIPCRGGGHLPL